MATKIIHKKSSVAAKVPLAGDLEVGELALNLVDKKIYSKRTDGTVVEMGETTVAPSQITGYNQVEIQTGGGSLDLYKSNWITDASTYNLPLANSVPAGTVIQVEQGETHKAQEPVVSRTGTDLIRYSGGTDTTITMDSSAPELLRFISNGTNEWSI